MLVKDFIEKFRWFNANASISINGVPVDKIEITYGTNEGVEPFNCQSIDVLINESPPYDNVINHVMCPGPSHCFNREYDPGQSDCQHCYDPPIDPDIPSFLRKG